jgi:hypothetical protein
MFVHGVKYLLLSYSIFTLIDKHDGWNQSLIGLEFLLNYCAGTTDSKTLYCGHCGGLHIIVTNPY